eukprot:1174548-Pyramimonas_sp.AAC.1
MRSERHESLVDLFLPPGIPLRARCPEVHRGRLAALAPLPHEGQARAELPHRHEHCLRHASQCCLVTAPAP